MSIQLRPYVVLFCGLVAASLAAVFVRLAQAEGMPSLVLAGGRLAIATLALSPLVLTRYTRDFQKLDARDWALAAACGVILGVHFSAWIASLEHTSLIASVVLVSTSPIFVNTLSFPLIGERVPRPIVVGTLIAVGGGAIVAWGGDTEAPSHGGDAPLLGNSLALVGAMGFALYLIIGRRFRAKMHFIPYIWLVYGMAAMAVCVPALLAGYSFLGYSARGYLWLAAIGLIPQLIGHSSFNYALGHLSAAYVGVISRLEAVVSTILGIVVLGEWPTLLAVAGSAIILGGVTMASWPVAPRPPSPSPGR